MERDWVKPGWRPEKPEHCVHLGADTGLRQACGSCGGRVQLKLFHCAHPKHPEPTALSACKTCEDRG